MQRFVQPLLCVAGFADVRLQPSPTWSSTVQQTVLFAMLFAVGLSSTVYSITAHLFRMWHASVKFGSAELLLTVWHAVHATCTTTCSDRSHRLSIGRCPRPCALVEGSANTAPLVFHVRQVLGGASREEELTTHHAFVVAYALARDLGLSFHVDSSDVTLNVCLGREFEGGAAQ